MKKTVIMFVMALLALAVTSCSPSAESVAKKIENRETLTRDDYNTIMTYMESACDDIEKAIESGNKDGSFDNLDQKYQYAQQFMEALMMAPKDEIDTDRSSKLIQRLFSLALKSQAGTMPS